MTRRRDALPTISLVAAAVGVAAVLASLPAPACAQGAGSTATARPDAGGPPWQTLTPAQQAALAPLKRDWPGIDAPRKQKWLEIAARFPYLPPEERERIQARMTDWTRLSPSERAQARLQFQEVRQISPQDRQARWDAYLALPAEQREALAQRAKTVPPAAGANSSGATVLPNQKVNVLNAPTKPATPTAVAPTVVQAKPGVSTTLISKTPTPPAHERPGEPKIALPPGQVNRATLLAQPMAAPVAPKAGPTAPAAAPTPAPEGGAASPEPGG